MHVFMYAYKRVYVYTHAYVDMRRSVPFSLL